MFLPKALLSLILITWTTVHGISVNRRTGKDTLTFIKRMNGNGAINIVEHDLARAQALFQTRRLGEREVTTQDITNSAIDYVAQVGIGSPPTKYTLLIDTGSANTWLGAHKSYVQTVTSNKIGCDFKVNYGSGGTSGKEWNDTVTLTPGLVINQQSIGVAQQANGLQPGDDGILGLGPVGLTRDTVTCKKTVPTVLDNLFSQKKILEKVLGVYFTPASESSSGELTFGGYDNSATVGPVTYVPLTTTYPASKWWGIDQSISYGNEVILDSTSGIVDTGSMLVLIASHAFERYQELTGAVLDPGTSMLKITPQQYAKLQSLKFNIGDKSYELTRNAQIWPRALNTKLKGGSPDAIYLVVGNLPSSLQFDFINGYAFLERYYSVYDATNKRVGFAPTKYTYSESN